MKRVSKEEWQKKILRELKDKKSLEDLKYSIGNLGSVDMLLQEEDRIINPEINTFPDSMDFGLYLKDPESNQKILQSLKYGASKFLITGQREIPWEIILKGVYLQMVAIYSNQEINKKNPDGNISHEKFQPFIINNDHIIDVGASIKNQSLFRILHRCTTDTALSSIFLVLDDRYIFTIALLRALRIILQKQNYSFTIGTISNPSGNEKEYDLIRYTLQVQASQAGGSNCHFFSASTQTSNDQITRMIHINNILNMESSHELPKDPWKGAYAIEHLTKFIMNNIEKGGPSD